MMVSIGAVKHEPFGFSGDSMRNVSAACSGEFYDIFTNLSGRRV